MYELMVSSNFSSAHSLKDYKGKCENLHGHNWKVEVYVASDKLDETGLVVDFVELKKVLSGILGRFDHKHLNEVSELSGINPTSENLARFIFDEFSNGLKVKNVKVSRVKVWEAENSYAEYK